MSCEVRLLRRALQLSGQTPVSQADAEELAAVLCVDDEIFPYLLLKRAAFEGNEALKRALLEVADAAPNATATRSSHPRNRIAEDASAARIAAELVEAVRAGVAMLEKDRLIAEADGTRRSPRDSDPSAPERWIGF